MEKKYVKGNEAQKILSRWKDHLSIEHGLPGECEIMKELTWTIGEATDGHVVLGLPKPKREE